MSTKYMPPARSLENLALGRKGQGKKAVNFSLKPETIATLRKAGNASRFIELLVEAYEGNRVLTPQEILEGKLRDTTLD